MIHSKYIKIIFKLIVGMSSYQSKGAENVFQTLEIFFFLNSFNTTTVLNDENQTGYFF